MSNSPTLPASLQTAIPQLVGQLARDHEFPALSCPGASIWEAPAEGSGLPVLIADQHHGGPAALHRGGCNASLCGPPLCLLLSRTKSLPFLTLFLDQLTRHRFLSLFLSLTPLPLHLPAPEPELANTETAPELADVSSAPSVDSMSLPELAYDSLKLLVPSWPPSRHLLLVPSWQPCQHLLLSSCRLSSFLFLWLYQLTC